MLVRDLFSVEGKVALVTGGSRGIGEMIAAGFLANGAKVYISSPEVDECRSTAERLTGEHGGECISVPGDVSDLAEIEALAADMTQREPRLHILVNNAAVTFGAAIDEYSESSWDEVMDTNLKGTFFLTQKLLPLLRSAATHEDPARVINIGSVDGIKNSRGRNFAYGPSKAAVHHLTRQMGAVLVKEHILVNAIAPGPFPTRMLARAITRLTGKEDVDWDQAGKTTPRGRLGTPEDIAGLAIFLSSRAGAFTVGATILCDGGAVACS